MGKQYYLLKGTNVIQLKDGEDEESFVRGILGRVVKDHDDPGRNFVPLKVDANGAAMPADKTDFDEWNDLLSDTKTSHLKVAIEKLFNIHHEESNTHSRDLKTKKVRRHFATDVDTMVEQVRKSTEVREKLNRWLPRGGARVWVIVGFIMAEDIALTEKDGSSRDIGGGLEPPGPIHGQDAPFKAEGNYKHTKDDDKFVKISKKSVIAIEYLALQRPRFTLRPDIDTVVRRGPGGPNAFGPGEEDDNDDAHDGNVGGRDGDIEVIKAPIVDVLKAVGHVDLESEACGEFSIAYDMDWDEEDDDEEDEEDEDHEEIKGSS
ncbi:hypothetical protein BCR34DRAFT_555078 [Clohesyomyces aquaticus]|uniref:Uncharacterized protein n=1 Tax=Clohesyomyces aquaticus TaxID=1231657 RepID=A0A1Y2A5U6_9PLEO|nr:hypothetical protein BCR34DRAFT_555078 [Clohesyomyces aquaticus]